MMIDHAVGRGAARCAPTLTVLFLLLVIAPVHAQDNSPRFEDIFVTENAALIDTDAEFSPPYTQGQSTWQQIPTYQNCVRNNPPPNAEVVPQSPNGRYFFYRCYDHQLYQTQSLRMLDTENNIDVSPGEIEMEPGYVIEIDRWINDSQFFVLVSRFSTQVAVKLYLVDLENAEVSYIGAQSAYPPVFVENPIGYEFSSGGTTVYHYNMATSDVQPILNYVCEPEFEDPCLWNAPYSNAQYTDGKPTYVALRMGHQTSFEKPVKIYETETDKLVYEAAVTAWGDVVWVAENKVILINVYSFSETPDSVRVIEFDENNEPTVTSQAFGTYVEASSSFFRDMTGINSVNSDRSML
ncbi:MAG: hypothetical protein AAFV33_11705, partial [Chloroflexota bacterium]